MGRDFAPQAPAAAPTANVATAPGVAPANAAPAGAPAAPAGPAPLAAPASTSVNSAAPAPASTGAPEDYKATYDALKGQNPYLAQQYLLNYREQIFPNLALRK